MQFFFFCGLVLSFNCDVWVFKSKGFSHGDLLMISTAGCFLLPPTTLTLVDNLLPNLLSDAKLA